jgi:hypothetical protein
MSFNLAFDEIFEFTLLNLGEEVTIGLADVFL